MNDQTALSRRLRQMYNELRSKNPGGIEGFDTNLLFEAIFALEDQARSTALLHTKDRELIQKMVDTGNKLMKIAWEANDMAVIGPKPSDVWHKKKNAVILEWEAAVKATGFDPNTSTHEP